LASKKDKKENRRGAEAREGIGKEQSKERE
jgi:hypothetical protein